MNDPTLFDDNDETIQARFEQFLAENPHVYRLFRQYAEQLLARGWDRYSADAILHRIRWHLNVEVAGDPAPKLNDHFTSRLARKLAGEDERFRSFFEFRRLRSA